MRKKYSSPRWKNYDYSSNNLYFITANEKYRNHVFGQIKNGKMMLNKFGKIVDEQWNWLPSNFSYVKIHEYIIMPNHFHGIIELDASLVVGSPKKTLPIFNIIGAFKTTSSKRIHNEGLTDFNWQRSFHDRIIRSLEEHYFIAKYIEDNPKKSVRSGLDLT